MFSDTHTWQPFKPVTLDEPDFKFVESDILQGLCYKFETVGSICSIGESSGPQHLRVPDVISW